MRRAFSILFAVSASFAVAQQPKLGLHPPKLVVLVSIDQFRADYVERFAPYYLPARSGGRLGGFRFLMETGADFKDAHHNHIPTATGPGHATLMTGSEPAYDGIVSNDWYDRRLGRSIYCVSDPQVQTVGGKSAPMSPRNLLVTTVGDELKMATGGRSKVVGVSFKDRAAILMAGHAADTVIWFESGKWVTSSWYAPSGQLPTWVQKLNAEALPDQDSGKTWTPLLPAEAYGLTRKAPAEANPPAGQPFAHSLGDKTSRGFYTNFTTSGFGQDYMTHAIESAIDGEKLGRHDVPDVLVINLATNDYVGHRYGPNSPEVMDVALRADRLLSDVFNKLNHDVPGGINDVAVVVTADHGVLPIPEESNDAYKTGSQRVTAVARTVQAALSKQFGDANWVLGNELFEQNLYLNRDAAAQKGLKMRDVEQAAADAAVTVPGIFAAVTRTQLLHGEIPRWPFADTLTNGFNAQLGGDVMVLEGPGALPDGGTGTSHGSIWAYDSHVPLLVRGPGIAPGSYVQTVYTSDIASTLCHLLGIEYPTGNVGHPLPGLK